MRANERSAAGAGIDVVRVKLIAFAIGSFIAGLGGSLIAYFQGNVTFDAFTTFVGLSLFATAYIGGITSVSGGLVAGLLAVGGLAAKAADMLPDLGQWYAVLSGVGLDLHDREEPRRHRRADPRQARRPAGQGRRPRPPRPSRRRCTSHRWSRSQGGEVVVAAISGVRVTYGGVVAVDGVDLEARQGTIVGLIGPNGAGKTTLLDAMSGFTPCTGTVTLAGRDLTALGPHQRVRAGLGRTFQQTQLYEDLSVAENVVVGAAGASAPRREQRRGDPRAARPHRRGRSARRRAVAGPPPARRHRPCADRQPRRAAARRAGRWPRHAARASGSGMRLAAIRDTGVTIVLIDHDMHLVLNLCDSIYVLDFGKVIAHGPPAAIKTDRTVAAAYLGSTHATAVAEMSASLFECRDLRAGYGEITIVPTFELDADAGTVVAILGPNGAGKTTLLTTLAGLLPAQAGTVPSTATRSRTAGRRSPPGPASCWSPTTGRCSRP